MNHNITDLGIPAESELRGIGISPALLDLRRAIAPKAPFIPVLSTLRKNIFITMRIKVFAFISLPFHSPHTS
jgi:hypothetical protein